MGCGSNRHLLNHARDASYKNSVGFHEKISTNTSILLRECSKAQTTDLELGSVSEIEIDTVFSALCLKWKKNAILSQLKLENYKNERDDQGAWFWKGKLILEYMWIYFFGILTYMDMTLI